MNSRSNAPWSFAYLVKRHLIAFLKNGPVVLFTLMVPIVYFAVYVLFLRGVEIQSIQGALNEISEYTNATLEEQKIITHQVFGIADTWMIAGVLSVSCITISLNANNLMIRDKQSGIAKDFISSPIPPAVITLSYLTFNVIITFCANLLIFFLGLIYLLCYGAYMISVVDFFAIIGLLLLGAISSALVMHFICSFVSSESLLASVTAIISAAIGFLIGAYLPANMMPDAINYFTLFIPGTYLTGLLRNYFMITPIAKLKANPIFSTGSGVIETIEENFSLNFKFFGYEITPAFMVLAIFISIIIFGVLNIFFSTKNYMNFLKSAHKRKKKQEVDKEHGNAKN